MKLSQLNYAIQKEYTIPYLPHMFYLMFICLLGILVPVNLVLAGSDVVTTLKSDPAKVENPSWMPRYWPDFLRPKIPQKCQPASITDDMSLRTNSSMPIFKYVLQRAYANKTDRLNPTNRIYPAPYLANKLSDCEVRTITWRVEIPAAIMKYQAQIYCNLGGDKPSESGVPWPDGVVFIMTHNRADNTDLGPDDMVDYITYSVTPEPKEHGGNVHNAPRALRDLPLNSSSSTNVLAALDGIYTDVSEAIWTQTRIWNAMNDTKWLDTYVVEWAAGTGGCRSGTAVNATCGSIIDDGRWRRWYGTTDDYGNDAAFILPWNVTITNAFIALRDAIMIDLGNAEPAANIYLNKTYFDEVIRVDPYHADGAHILENHPGIAYMNSTSYWNFCSYWTCVHTSWAEALRNQPEDAPLGNIVLPYRPNGTQAPSVLSFRYLCPTFQRKSTNALIVSVFVSTATIISSLYMMFDLCMPKAEAYYQERRKAFAQAINRNIEDQAEDEYPLVKSPLTRVRTSNSSNTLYDPVPQTEKDKDGRYN